MTEVQIGFGAVFGYVYFAVLIRAHGAGIDINVRVEFLSGYFETA